jgi:hypothetical protein
MRDNLHLLLLLKPSNLHVASIMFQRPYINMDSDQHRRLSNLLSDIRSDVLPQPSNSYRDFSDNISDDDDSDASDRKFSSTDCK